MLTAGPHTIVARAKDNEGNTADSSTITITIQVTTSGNFELIYTAAGSNSYGPMSSTGASADFTGIGEKLTTSSSLIGSAIKRVAVILKKSGNTSGTIFVRIRNSSGTIVKEFGTIDAAALTTADQTFTLTASTAYILKANDVVLVEWYGTGSLADIVNVKRSGADVFDGSNTYYVTRKTSGSYTNTTSRDMAGQWFYET